MFTVFSGDKRDSPEITPSYPYYFATYIAEFVSLSYSPLYIFPSFLVFAVFSTIPIRNPLFLGFEE
jgi:hypothetical protein